MYTGRGNLIEGFLNFRRSWWSLLSITKLNAIHKLVNITNRFWLTPLECAEEAVNEVGSAEFPFCVQYRALACADDNDIELVNNQSLLPLCWQPALYIVPRSFFFFLHQISRQISDQVFILFIYWISESF